MPPDRDTLLVFGAFIPSLLGLVAIGVAGALRGGGDAALAQVGGGFRSALPRTALAARLGGEEFAVLLPGSTPGEAMAVAEALRATAEARPWRAEGGERVPVQLSIGVASGADGLEALLRRADAALYRAKAEGRNRVAAG